MHARARPASDDTRGAHDSELAALLAAAARGDGRAFEDFYDRTCGRAHAAVRRLLGGAEGEDVLADAYFEAWRAAARFDAMRGSALGWLLAIVRHRALDALRRRAAQPVAPDGEAALASLADDGPDPIEALWRRQCGQRLGAALAALDARERWALGLAYFRDCTHAEVARITGLPLGTVKSLLRRAQARLRAQIAPTS